MCWQLFPILHNSSKKSVFKINCVDYVSSVLSKICGFSIKDAVSNIIIFSQKKSSDLVIKLLCLDSLGWQFFYVSKVWKRIRVFRWILLKKNKTCSHKMGNKSAGNLKRYGSLKMSEIHRNTGIFKGKTGFWTPNKDTTLTYNIIWELIV